MNITEDDLSKIVQEIKESYLCNSCFPKLIIGTGLSKVYGLPGMYELSEELENKISTKDQTVVDEWKSISQDIRDRGLETGLSKSVSSNLLNEIKIITSNYILKEETEKFYNNFSREDGFIKLLNFLKNTVSVNQPVIDIMTPNYDRTIELCLDKLNVKCITGYEGNCFKTYKADLINNPIKYYKEQKIVRLYKPHGSINLVNINGNIIESNDNVFLENNIDNIQIITPGISKYETGMTNTTFSKPREAFDTLLLNNNNYSILTFGYGFNDSHFNSTVFDALKNNAKAIIVISYTVPKEIIENALTNPKYIIFCIENEINIMIYKQRKYTIDRNLGDINEFSSIFF